MDIQFNSDGERARFVRLMHNGKCRLDQARAAMAGGADGLALAMYYRVDTEIAARAYQMLPTELKLEIEAGDEPPGK